MSSDQLVLVVLLQAAFFAAVGGMIGNAKGRPGTGAIWGFILGIFGIVIIALMPPTKEKEAERNRNLANAFASAGGGYPSGTTIPQVVGRTADFRDAAIAEAVRREPTLRGADDEASLRRLGELVAQISDELQLKVDLDRVRKAEEDARLATARRAADEAQAAAEQARRVAEAEEAEQLKADRLARMNPLGRWMTIHPVGSVLIVAALLVAVVSGVVAVQNAQANTRKQAEALQAAADAKAAADAATKLAAAELAERKLACAGGAGVCRVGDPGPGGGIVFFDAGPGKTWGQFLEAAPAGWSSNGSIDEEARSEWCSSPLSKAIGTKQTLGSGPANTDLVAKACPQGAAALALNYAGGGKKDWFLPSLDELRVLKAMGSTVGGMATDAPYWSSSSNSAKRAWTRTSKGSDSSALMADENYFRPIRAF